MRQLFPVIVLLLAGCQSAAWPPAEAPAASQTPISNAFGLTGFGSETRAGQGGQIIRVTNLQASGAGSLRAALETSGPRIIVFEVGGIIDLGKTNLRIKEPFVTIAGQTAPSPGITLIRGGLSISTHDVLLQHLRWRMGDAGEPKYTEPGFGKGWDVDATTEGKNAYNIVVDHCSFAWAVDENLSISGPRLEGPAATSHRITLSNNIIAEGLHVSTHSKKQPHSKGTLVHDNVRDVAIIGNLYAHNDQRNPLFKGGTTGVVVNNLIYNPGSQTIQAGWWAPEWTGHALPELPRLAVVGNHLIRGANSRPDRPLVGLNQASKHGPSGAEVFAADNLISSNVPVAELGDGITRLATKPLWPANLQTIPASAVKESVLSHAGARPLDRDAVDSRIVGEVRTGRGQIINSQNEVGGYPQAMATYRQLDIPQQNVESWLRQLSDALIPGNQAGSGKATIEPVQ